MQHAVSHRADFLHALDDTLLGVLQRREHHLRGFHVVLDKLGDLHHLFVGGGLLQVAALNGDALHLSLGDDLFSLHVDQLILQGGRTGIDNQNFHGLCLLTRMYL